MKSSKSSKISRLLRLLLGLVIIGAASLVFVLKSPFFDVKELNIEGISDLESAVANNAIWKNIDGKKIFNINQKYISDVIERSSPEYKVTSYSYTFPNKIHLTLGKREAKYIIQASNGFFSADAEGFIIEKLSTSKYSNVIYDKSIETGKKVSDLYLKAALSYANLNQIINVSDNKITITLKNGGTVILPVDSAVKNISELSKTLQKIIQKYTIEGRELELIDLRFSKPLVKYN